MLQINFKLIKTIFILLKFDILTISTIVTFKKYTRFSKFSLRSQFFSKIFYFSPCNRKLKKKNTKDKFREFFRYLKIMSFRFVLLLFLLLIPIEGYWLYHFGHKREQVQPENSGKNHIGVRRNRKVC